MPGLCSGFEARCASRSCSLLSVRGTARGRARFVRDHVHADTTARIDRWIVFVPLRASAAAQDQVNLPTHRRGVQLAGQAFAVIDRSGNARRFIQSVEALVLDSSSGSSGPPHVH